MYIFLKKYHHKSITAALCLIAILCCTACDSTEKKRFHQLSPQQSGITFNNTVTETDSLNILNFHYIYNGGGVGVGDFDNNGLADVIFTGNQVPSKLYMNKGGLQFEDISVEANFNTKGWATGVSVIDLNGDGWEDIYISVGGFVCDGTCKNQLFINQGLNENGLPSFKEMAEDYGLADGQYTQQAAFFDYDRDGDLDVYLLHNVIDQRDKNMPSEKRFINANAKDQLLRNDGMDEGGNIVFRDVSEESGIVQRGYGLGITITDFNKDGWPDVYVANDFLSDDLMYINKGGKGKAAFEEGSRQYLKHCSYNSMGVDIADINNDALADIFVLDMMPEYQERQKTMLGFMNYNKFMLSLRQGYSPQFIRNTLQVHNGFVGNDMAAYSEVGYLAGVYNTDWSWTPLLADFDNDGDRDIYVTNGYGKDITDLDFINYTNQAFPFGTKESRQKAIFEIVQKMEPIKMANFIFENKGDLKFENQSGNWTTKTNSISNGATYADLDNDGDLDILVNNIDEVAYLLENTLEKNEKNNYLKIKLKGPSTNTAGIGTAIYLWTNGEAQYHYQSPIRGYLSTVESTAHFGLGSFSEIDSIKLIWPNGQVDILKNVPANQTLEVKFQKEKETQAIAESSRETNYLSSLEDEPLFKLIQSKKNIRHKENRFQDFDAQPLLLHQHSRQGPCLAAANVDGKPGDEIFIGGAKGFPSRILFPQAEKQGTYKIQTLPDSLSEDTDAVFFDADQDGDLDLYVVSGGVEFSEGAEELQDRLYLNDGNGNFERDHKMLPKNWTASGSCVVPADYDQDGDIDLFVGSRVQPRAYPRTPRSELLTNHNGRFIANTEKFAYGLSTVGMVTDALWSDYNQDGKLDLMIVGEWMPLTIFKNAGGGNFKHGEAIEQTNGLWNCITAADIDNDGDDDYLLGNLGENSRLQASMEEPITVYKNDFDNNGSPDPLVSYFYENKKGERKSYPIHARDDAMKQLTTLKRRYEKYVDFGQVTFPELLQTEIANTDDQLFATELKSIYIENKGKGNLDITMLPQKAQYAPIQSILIDDFDKDGHKDVLLSGNDYGAEKNGGWYDAFNGLLLKGNGKGAFEAVSTTKSNFYLPGDGRDIIKMKDAKGKQIIVAGQNDGEIKMFE